VGSTEDGAPPKREHEGRETMKSEKAPEKKKKKEKEDAAAAEEEEEKEELNPPDGVVIVTDKESKKKAAAAVSDDEEEPVVDEKENKPKIVHVKRAKVAKHKKPEAAVNSFTPERGSMAVSPRVASPNVRQSNMGLSPPSNPSSLRNSSGGSLASSPKGVDIGGGGADGHDTAGGSITSAEARSEAKAAEARATSPRGGGGIKFGVPMLGMVPGPGGLRKTGANLASPTSGGADRASSAASSAPAAGGDKPAAAESDKPDRPVLKASPGPASPASKAAARKPPTKKPFKAPAPQTHNDDDEDHGDDSDE